MGQRHSYFHCSIGAGIQHLLTLFMQYLYSV